MFTKLIHRETTQKLTARAVCVLFTALLVVGNVLAEDEPVEIEPNGFTWVLDLFSKVWDTLAGLFA